jgi:hypothetical protein
MCGWNCEGEVVSTQEETQAALERARRCSIHNYSVRVAVVIGGMPLMRRNKLWLDKTIRVQAADMDAVYGGSMGSGPSAQYRALFASETSVPR